MSEQKIIIFRIKHLFEIFKELEDHFDYDVYLVNSQKELKDKVFSNSILLSDQSFEDNYNHIKLQFPINFKNLIEKINIKFLRINAKEKSSILIGLYEVDLNSRKLKFQKKEINLTEKEVDLIMFLNSANKPIGIEQLEMKVWGFKSKLETHTVETHIYRLRKKISENFKKNDFILSDKNGYFLNN